MALIRGLRWLLLLGLAVLVGGIVVSLSANVRMAPRALAERPNGADADRIAQRASNAERVRPRRGAPTLRMEALDSTTYTNGRLDLTRAVFHVFAPDGEETIVQAPAAEMIPYAEEPAANPKPSTRPG